VIGKKTMLRIVVRTSGMRISRRVRARRGGVVSNGPLTGGRRVLAAVRVGERIAARREKDRQPSVRRLPGSIRGSAYFFLFLSK
jgi:hypothetical protein